MTEPSMNKFAAAQSASIPADIPANVERHLGFVQAAAAESVTLLVFPELSLTGYELPRLQGTMVEPDDPRLAPLRQAAQTNRMTIIVGAPVGPAQGHLPAIGAVCFHADGSSTVYRKRFLHPGEEVFVSPGDRDAQFIDLNGEGLALAICADTTKAEHAQWAREAGAAVYVAGVLWSEKGYDADAALVQRHTSPQGLAALVANHATPSGGFSSAGRSAFWSPEGHLIAQAPPRKTCLLTVVSQGASWAGHCIELNEDGR